ncbi:MAG: FAD-binding protein [Myxococcales bacterium]|nr:FAD-binding protein [Myxococcales bacterium]
MKLELHHVEALVRDPDALDDAMVDRLVELVDAEPERWLQLAEQVLESDADAPKAAPFVWEPSEHVASVEGQAEQRGFDDTRVLQPTTLRRLVDRVRAAAERGLAVRPVGSFRSHSDVADPSANDGNTVVIALSHLNAVHVDVDSRQVTVQAGCNVGRLNEVLDGHGLALANMGSGDFQTVAGAVSTGTHGSASSVGDLSALVIGIDLLTIDEQGRPRLLRLTRPGATVHAPRHPAPGNDFVGVVQEDSPDIFRAALQSLGCFGVVTALTLEVVPRFFLGEQRRLIEWSELHDTFADRATAVGFYEVLVNPFRRATSDIRQSVLVTEREVVDGPNAVQRSLGLSLAASAVGTAVARSRLRKMLKKSAIIPKRVQQGLTCSTVTNYRRKSFRVLKIGLKIDALGAELAVPLAHAIRAVDRMCEVVQSRWQEWQAGGDRQTLWRTHALPTSPLSMRIVAPSDALLSVTRGQTDPVVCIEQPMLLDERREGDGGDALYVAYREGVESLFAELEDLLCGEFGARPHWGLRFASGPVDIERMYGDAWETWKVVRARLDPRGVFRSAFTQRMALDALGTS